MELPSVEERSTSAVNVVTIGATTAEGGTREKVIKVGGARTLPFLDFEGEVGERPVVAMDVLDMVPEDWPEALAAAHRDAWDDPGKWAKKCVEEYGADLICIKLDGTHPDKGDKSPEEAVEAVTKVKEAVGVPLIVWSAGDDEKDNKVMPKVSQALAGENCLLGTVSEDNYKTLTAVCIADNHNLIALAPIDINIAKQVNILVTDMGFPLERIVMFQTTGALGYGLEYVYSIQERQRLAALAGDKMMQMPMICDVGYESWRAKEAKTPDEDAPEWGPQADRGTMWETITAVVLLQSGVDILRMRHPRAVEEVKKVIDELFAPSEKS
ncbi:MAG: acetyl-CoA decarbonylase/synthase complex subunit delta [Planctomycetes bacterium DG_23]|nr:MAG: acetyl-CoA decarbonylase/synthase complex subunit delta [Planctomycetes bacterium DG_23]